MILSLGLFTFSVPTLAYDELQRKSDWQHARSARVGVRDASQYVGPGDDKVSLNGTAFAELSDGTASLDDLRVMAGSGDAWPLVDGTGRVYGAFVIEAIDERQKFFLPDGTPRQIDFGIDLMLVEDPA
ncbi:MAG: phage tail protein [Sphingomonas sp.]|jgi:hypothetical protein|uniref:phage tail protein n=1 Tax=Sphingomonas sp. TaxID=28214 RepID=UPI003564F278